MWFYGFLCVYPLECVLACNLTAGVSDRGARIQELAASANQSATSTFRNVLGLSQKLRNTSSDLSRVNATLQETDQLLRDSSMTSTWRSPPRQESLRFASSEHAWGTEAPCAQRAFLNTKKAPTSGFAPRKKRAWGNG